MSGRDSAGEFEVAGERDAGAYLRDHGQPRGPRRGQPAPLALRPQQRVHCAHGGEGGNAVRLTPSGTCSVAQ